MKLVHQFTKPGIFKNTNDDNAFLLVNSSQDFVSFYSEEQSRYEGFFAKQKGGYVKILSRIIPAGEKASEVVNFHLFNVIGRKVGDFWESYFLAKNDPAIIYELSHSQEFSVRLDMRKIFEFPQWGRYYEVTPIKDGVMVKYREDGKNVMFAAFLSDGDFKSKETWKQVSYNRDAERHSRPASLYEFELGKFKATKLVVAYGNSEKEALKIAREYFDESKISFVRIGLAASVKSGDKKAVKTATYCCQKTIHSLFRDNSLLAGLPWFVSPWSRDELLSLPALSDLEAKKVIRKYLKNDWPSGKIPTIVGGGQLSSDALGIFCWAIMHMGLKLSIDDKIALTDKLIKAVGELEKQENQLGFVYSGTNESWMDSIGREGYPIETQALYLKILQLTYFLTKDQKYDNKQAQLLKNIRIYFLHTHNDFPDRLGEQLVRPNIFLAAFFAPEILTKAEWEKCFDKVLPKIWLNWGGLASVDKNSELYNEESSGEDNVSYHNGDSWFFVNNIAALVLLNTNRLKYAKVAKKILEASTDEILWHDFMGFPGEISSARVLDSWGCGAQTFSASTYLYLAGKMDIRKNKFAETQAKNDTAKHYIF